MNVKATGPFIGTFFREEGVKVDGWRVGVDL